MNEEDYIEEVNDMSTVRENDIIYLVDPNSSKSSPRGKVIWWCMSHLDDRLHFKRLDVPQKNDWNVGTQHMQYLIEKESCAVFRLV